MRTSTGRVELEGSSEVPFRSPRTVSAGSSRVSSFKSHHLSTNASKRMSLAFESRYTARKTAALTVVHRVSSSISNMMAQEMTGAANRTIELTHEKTTGRKYSLLCTSFRDGDLAKIIAKIMCEEARPVHQVLATALDSAGQRERCGATSQREWAVHSAVHSAWPALYPPRRSGGRRPAGRRRRLLAVSGGAGRQHALAWPLNADPAAISCMCVKLMYGGKRARSLRAPLACGACLCMPEAELWRLQQLAFECMLCLARL